VTTIVVSRQLAASCRYSAVLWLVTAGLLALGLSSTLGVPLRAV
jgi:hypothetical protein